MPYWVWISLGMMLVILKIFVPNFVIVWFGVAAIFVGWLRTVTEPSLTYQLVFWALLSLALLGLLLLFIKPRTADKTKAGLSREAVVGAVGHVMETSVGQRRGKVRFWVPLLGAEEWSCLVHEGKVVAVGDRVQVVDIVGNVLVVCPM
ncbi:MAG: NfeD family protein [Desulfosoma sp.]